MVSSMQICQCPIYNGTLEILIRCKKWKVNVAFSHLKIVYFCEFLYCVNSLNQEMRMSLFAEKPQLKLNSLDKQKH